MTIDNIKALIATDESRTLEMKKTTGELKDGMHSACAFLNTDDGWLIFGIAPKSLKILGQEVSYSTQQEIAKAIIGLEPAVDVKIHYVDVPDRPGNKVIAMHFDGWVWGERLTEKPQEGLYICKQRLSDGTVKVHRIIK